LQAAILSLLVRRRGHELLTGVLAVDARVGGQLPGIGAERAAERPVSRHDLRKRWPRSARRAVAVIPALERCAELLPRCGEQGPLQRVDEGADRELSSQPDEIRGETP